MLNSDFSTRLREALERNDMTAAELSRKTGLSKPLLSQYINGKVKAKSFQLLKLAEALDVSEPWLMGFDVPRQREGQFVKAISTRRIPILGEIACGQPSFAEESFEAYVEVGSTLQCDFALRAKGDSMTGARILDGDIVFIKQQPIVNNGDIAAVIIGDEATLKRVYFTHDKLVLAAENPSYQPLVYVGSELDDIRILGKAVAFQSDVR